MQTAEYPVSGAEVAPAADAVVGERMECPDCGTGLDGLEVDPPALGEAPGSRRTGGGEVWMVEYVTGPGP